MLLFVIVVVNVAIYIVFRCVCDSGRNGYNGWGGVVCKAISMSNPTLVEVDFYLSLSLYCDNEND